MQRHLPLVLALITWSCDKPAPAVQEAPPAVAETVAEPVRPAEVAPQSPDFEDTAGSVRIDRSGKFIDIPGERPLCMPFEAPAELMKNGVSVRLTAYLKAGAQSPECRPITLISARTVD